VACGGLDTLEGDLGALGEVQLRDGSSSSSLDGSTVSGEIVVYVEEHNRITKVEFYLDDPEVKGAPFKAFSSPPYEAVIDTRTLEDGTHTFTALVFVGKGKKAHVVENATFTVAKDWLRIVASSWRESVRQKTSKPLRVKGRWRCPRIS
jgi:hypothetical protein